MEALEVILMPFYFAARLMLGRHSDGDSIFIMMLVLMGIALCVAIVLAAMWFSII